MEFQNFVHAFGVKVSLSVGDHLFKQGDRDACAYFLRSGLLKAYYLSSDGKESIKSFFTPGNIVGSLSSAYGGTECSFSAVALRDAEIIKLPFEKLLSATKESTEISQFAIQQLLALSMKKEVREYEFLSLSAEERYQAWCQREPELLEELTQQDMARYLGITPVALSRIKKRIRTKASKAL